jgi:hypothetical protein
MEPTMTSKIIEAFGGVTALSRALGHKNATTVQGWKKSDKIPPWRHKAIVDAAAEVGVKLPLDFAPFVPRSEDAAQ